MPNLQFDHTMDAGVAAPHRVLRNTYALLAVSMLPTTLGALLGVQMRFALFASSPLLSFLLFLAIAFGFMWGIQRHKNSGIGVALLLGFTFFMGLMLSGVLQVALSFANGGTLIAMAAGGTGAIFLVMAGIAATSRRDFSKLGGFLFAGLILLLVAMVANIFFNIPALMLVISLVAVVIFSAYILYDVNRIVRGGETNYVTATLSVYLDVYNVFINLLNLLMLLSGRRE